MADIDLDELFARHSSGVRPDGEFERMLLERMEQELGRLELIEGDAPLDLGDISDAPAPIIGPAPDAQLPRWRTAVALAAAAVILVVIGLGAWLAADRNSQAPVQTDELLDPESIVDRYYAAIETGDIDALRALVGPDTVLVTGDFENPASAWETLYLQTAWAAGQRRDIGDRNCERFAVDEGAKLVFLCRSGVRYAPALAVGADPIESSTRFEIVDGHLVSVDHSITVDDDPALVRAFERWVRLHLPGVDDGSLRAWTSADDAAANGARRASLAADWAGYLRANECGSFDRTCGWANVSIEEWGCNYAGPTEFAVGEPLLLAVRADNGLRGAGISVFSDVRDDVDLETPAGPPGNLRIGTPAGSLDLAGSDPFEVTFVLDTPGTWLITCGANNIDPSAFPLTVTAN